MAGIAGGCLRDRVRDTARGEPAFVGICHCRNCQPFTGSAFEAVVALPATPVAVGGTRSTYYIETDDSGGPLSRRFCLNCGSSLVTDVAAVPGLVLLLVSGTLDEPGRLTPSI